MEKKNNGLAIASLVCGIGSVVFAFLFTWIGLILGVLAIIFSVKARKNAVAGQTGMCTAGLVLGIIGTSLSAVFIACALCVIGTVTNAVNSLQ